MGARFEATARTGIVSTAPWTSGPTTLTIGLWAYPTLFTGDTRTMWWTGDEASAATNRLVVYFDAAGGPTFSMNASNSAAAAQGLNQWIFVLARAMSSTARIIQVMNERGVVANGAIATAASSVLNVDSVRIGHLKDTNNANSRSHFVGSLAHLWYAEATTLINPTTALPDDAVRHLARYGPFRSKHIISERDLVEYHSFEHGWASKNGEYVPGKYGKRDWSPNTFGVAPLEGPSPPLDLRYGAPGIIVPRNYRKIIVPAGGPPPPPPAAQPAAIMIGAGL